MEILSDAEPDPFHNSSESDEDYVPKTKKPSISTKISDYFKNLQPSTSTSRYTESMHFNVSDVEIVAGPTSPTSATASTISTSTSLSTTTEVSNIGKCKNTPMLDGTFFLVETCDKNSHVEAVCQLCLPSKKIIKGSAESTTNFVKHLKRVHGNKSYDDYLKHKEKLKHSKSKLKGTNSRIGLAGTKSKQAKLSIINSKSVVTLVTQKEFEKRIVYFIVNTMSAVSIIENESFLRLFDGMNVNVPRRKAAMRLINEMYNSHTENLKKEIQKQDYVCSTADIWSTKTRSFMGVTLHWIDANLERKSVALACKRFTGTHDYKNIGEMLENINLNFNIRSAQIVATVTDNGSNFVKAFREFSVTEESQRLEVNKTRHGLDEDNEDNEEEEEDQMNEIEYDEEEVTVHEIEVSNTLDNDNRTIMLPAHIRCASHTLNLIATTDCKNAIQSNLTLRTRHTQVFSKCNILWAKAGRPKSAEIIKVVLGHTLSYPGITRWNSYFDSVSQILNVKAKLPALCQRLNIKHFKETELQFLEEYCIVLKPLALTLDVLQGQDCVYYGYLLPSLLSLRNKWEKLKLQCMSSNGELLLRTCMDSLNRRFSDILNLTSESAIISAVVHPKFKLRWFNVLKTPKYSLDAIKKLVIGAAEQLYIDDDDNGSERAGSSDTTPDDFFDFNEPEPETSKHVMFTNTSQPATEKEAVKTSKIELQLYKYLDDKRSGINSLNDYPIIKKIFLRYNTCLPSSAPVERLFSFASIVNSPRRNALSDSSFEKLVIMKANKVTQ